MTILCTVRSNPPCTSPSQVEGDCFYPRSVPAPVTFSDSPQPDRHSIPIALGPAQFNEFYRQRPPHVFPTLRIFFGGRPPPIECSSLSVAISLRDFRSRQRPRGRGRAGQRGGRSRHG